MQRHSPRNEETQPAPPEPPPGYSEDGVDLTLIRWMLSLSPAERLSTLQNAVHSILGLRHGKPDA